MTFPVSELSLRWADSGSIVLLSRAEEKSDMTALFPRYGTLGHTGTHWDTLGLRGTRREADQEIQILSSRLLLLLLLPTNI